MQARDRQEVTVLVPLLATALASAQQMPTYTANEVRRAPPDVFDVGVGLDMGMLPGLKIRVAGTSGRLFLGADLDVGSLLIINDLTVSGIMGGSYEVGARQVIRPYGTLGTGYAVGIFGVAGPVLHGGLGVEWKPGRAFGLGVEGGATSIMGEGGGYPYARLTTTVYAF
jgi:hypothetical protein